MDSKTNSNLQLKRLLPEMQQTKEKKFFVSEIIVFQLIMINSLY